MNKFKISLIIPAYNEEKYIGTCLEYAIKNSNNLFMEIIVIDNASTDNTSAIALKYPNVRVVREDKKGLTKARQRGYEESKGDILAYIDADTRMPELWCDVLIKEFDKNKNLVCLSGPCFYYDISLIKKIFVKYVYWYLLGMPTYYFVGYMVQGSNFAIKRETLNKMNGFDTNIEFYGEDTNIARRASEFGKVKFKSDFIIYASGRRFYNQGLIKTGLIYMSNFLSEAFTHKPTTNNYKDFR